MFDLDGVMLIMRIQAMHKLNMIKHQQRVKAREERQRLRERFNNVFIHRN